jgi:DNA repair protein RadD
MELRTYQKEAVENTVHALRAGAGNPLVVMPTGSGKGLCIAELCRRLIGNIIIASHTQEIVERDYEEIKAYWPEADAGIVCHGLGKMEYGHAITLGTP